MGGQDGYARDLLGYDSTSNVLMVGVTVKPSETFDMGLSLTWTASEAALDPFALPADDYVATHPPTSYDFSETHTYSDLDTSRLDLQVDGRYHFNKAFWLNAAFRYADFSDDAPYLYDTSGSLSLYTVALGWKF